MSPTGKILVGVTVALTLTIVSVAAFWLVRCPCGTIPGFMLRGVLQEDPVTDWRFANEVPLCQIQIPMGWRPHSLNVNCMATSNGDLYLSCSFGERKYWCPRVRADHPARLRLDGVLYPVILNRETDPTRLEQAWRARVGKLQNPAVLAVQPAGVAPPPDAPRPDSWWSFRVQSSASD